MQCQSAINKLALGEFLFESSDDQVIPSQHYAKKSFLSLPFSTQLEDNKAKETDFCGSTGRDESKISNIVMIRSVVLSQVTSSVKESEDFKIRNRRHDEERGCACGQRHTIEALTVTCDQQRQLRSIYSSRITHCENFLSK